jgi:signal transduction histidine kinase
MPSWWLAGGAETDPLLERAERRVRELVTEQAALRKVAILVAREPTPDQLFAGVSEQVACVLAVPHVRLVRYEPEGPVVVGGFSEDDDEPFPIGSRWPLESAGVTAAVRQTDRPARVDDHAPMMGKVAAVARGAGMLSAVVSPIVVGRRSWGAMVVLSPRQEPLPKDTESRLTVFTELVATAIATAESRAALARLADEQAALRRVAMIAARESSPVGIFGAVAEEAARVSDSEAVGILRFEPDGTATLVAQSETPWDPPPLGTSFTLEGENVVAAVHRTGEAARSDDWSSATGSVAAMAHVLGVRSALAAPIVVEGSVWGALIAATSQTEPLGEETELRISEFTELVATAISNAESREALGLLADEQAALRRVAELVARGIKPEEVFRAVSAEVGVLFGADFGEVIKFEEDETVTVFAATEAAGKRATPDSGYGVHQVRETGRSARFDSDDLSPAEIGPFVRSLGIRSGVASPIVLDGKLWGAITAVSLDQALAPGVEHRLNEFTALVATAIANAQSRRAVERLVNEQSALRRLATLVAKESSLADVLTGVADELANVLGEVEWALVRDDGDKMASVLAVSDGNPTPVNSRVPIDAGSAFGRAIIEGRPARVDNYFAGDDDFARIARQQGIQAAVSCPIVVRGRTWGAMSVGWRDPVPLPPETETVVERFSDLVATAIANSEARAEVERLAEEQAALRRVATLVAEGVPADKLFAGVTTEVANVFLDVDPALGANVTRFEPGPELMIVGVSTSVAAVPLGSRIAPDELFASTHVLRTGRSARIRADDVEAAGTKIADFLRRHGYLSQVACPIVVDGHLWGAMSVNSRDDLPHDTEERLERFTELVATAIANAESSAELAASRRRIVAAADEARRRIERDLHDGIQQRLIALSFHARAMARKAPDELPRIAAELSQGLKDVSEELREVSRGIHPTILTEAGLGPALRALARRSDLPIDVDVRLDQRLPSAVETAAYYIASEALTNVAKHAHANVVALTASHDNGVLTLEVRDDGIGGVDAGRGSGILGLTDRAEALGGRISIVSPSRRGTTLTVRLPSTA